MKTFFRFGLMGLIFFLPFYHPVRFTTGFIYEIPIMLLGLMVILIWTSFIQQFLKHRILLTKLDVLVGLLALYTFILLVFSDGRIYDTFNIIRLLIIPIFLYYVVSFNFTNKHNNILLFILIFSGAITSIFYILEIYKYVILGEGYFGWTIGLMNHISLNQLGRVPAATSFTGTVAYTRIAGFIGHNHATGFFMGFSSIGFFLLAIKKKKMAILWYLLAFLGGLAMIISMSRSAIFSIGFGYIVIFIFLKNKSKKILILTSLIILFIIATNSIFTYEMKIINEATHHFFSYEQISYVIGLMVNAPDINQYLYQLTIYPFSLFSGVGFSPTQSTPPVFSDDIHFISLFSKYGILGLSLFLSIIILATKYSIRCIKINGQNLFLFLTPLLYVLTIMMTTIHSEVWARISLYPVIFIMLGIINVNYRETYCSSKKLN